MHEEKTIEIGTDLDAASEEFLKAGRRYRAFLKRYYRDRLRGVVWIKSGNELVLYCESGKYAEQLKSLSFDQNRDTWINSPQP